MTFAERLAQDWKSRFEQDCQDESSSTCESVVRWLLGDKPERFDTLNPTQLTIASGAIDFLYRILLSRYLGVPPEKAYRNLIGRLGGLVVLRQKIQAWVSLSRDRQRTAVEVLQEVIQEMLNSDRYLQQQVAWIAECTSDKRLRNALLLASTEEYCLRPIRNQPLLVYRFVNYLRRSQRGGLTQVPAGDWVRLVSEQVLPDDTDEPLSLLDEQAMFEYRENQAWEDRQAQRQNVQQEFENYLAKEVDPLASRWLRLYLQGRSQESIAEALNVPIKQIYRLREKVSYHAIRVFAVKQAPELVATWLETSLQEHSLGLTPGQWDQYWENLTPVQRLLIESLKSGKSVEAIASELKLKTNQVIGEWSKLYLAAQSLRNE
ncbi:MAG: HetZ-related protein 2 [Microcoleus sp. CSU_2_2]|nr:HetZ-related protein 2 [Microcoleus sp. SU_5_3]NJS11664.1 HetZ-related protein 2 [Microcoleus sp. CSU_2_2]